MVISCLFPRLSAKIVTVFHLTTKCPSFLRGGIVYEFEHEGATYYWKTKRHFNIKMREHFLIYILIETKVKANDDSAIKKYILFCSRLPGFEDLSIFTISNNDFKFKLTGSCLTSIMVKFTLRVFQQTRSKVSFSDMP